MAFSFGHYFFNYYIRMKTHLEWSVQNPVIEEGRIILVTDIPGWWRIRKVRRKIGDGKTSFRDLKYMKEW